MSNLLFVVFPCAEFSAPARRKDREGRKFASLNQFCISRHISEAGIGRFASVIFAGSHALPIHCSFSDQGRWSLLSEKIQKRYCCAGHLPRAFRRFTAIQFDAHRKPLVVHGSADEELGRSDSPSADAVRRRGRRKSQTTVSPKEPRTSSRGRPRKRPVDADVSTAENMSATDNADIVSTTRGRPVRAVNVPVAHISATKLDEWQQQAVEAAGAVLVRGGAGCGKTMVTHEKVCRLLSSGVDPRSIVAVVLSGYAAHRLKEHVAASFGNKTAKALDTVGTFQDVAAWILRDHSKQLNLPNDFMIYERDDQLTLLADIMKKMGIDPRGAKYVQRQISMAKSRMKRMEEVAASQAGSRGTISPEELVEIAQRYEDKLVELRAIDKTDLCSYAVAALQRNPAVLKALHDRWHHVVLDILLCDCTPSEYALLKILSSTAANILAVDDINQAICSWRGADTANQQHFLADFPTANVVQLHNNYRSTATIVQASAAILHPARDPAHPLLVPTREQGLKVTVVEAANDEDEADYIAQQVNHLATVDKIEPSDIAILFRQHEHANVVLDAMHQAGVPAAIRGGETLFKKREVKDLLAFLRLMVNPLDEPSLARVLNVPPRGIVISAWESLCSLSAEHELPVLTLLTKIADGDKAIKHPFNSRSVIGIRQFLALLEDLQERTADVDVTTATRIVIEETKYLQHVQELYEAPVSHQRWENVDTFLHFTKQITSKGRNGLVKLLQQVALQSEVDELIDSDRNEVNVMSFKAARGLTFRAVFLMAFETGVLPMQDAFDNPAKMDDDRRHAYMACNRASDRLILTCALSRLQFNKHGIMPSVFLNDIPHDLKLFMGTDALEGFPGAFDDDHQFSPEKVAETLSNFGRLAASGLEDPKVPLFGLDPTNLEAAMFEDEDDELDKLFEKEMAERKKRLEARGALKSKGAGAGGEAGAAGAAEADSLDDLLDVDLGELDLDLEGLDADLDLDLDLESFKGSDPLFDNPSSDLELPTPVRVKVPLRNGKGDVRYVSQEVVLDDDGKIDLDQITYRDDEHTLLEDDDDAPLSVDDLLDMPPLDTGVRRSGGIREAVIKESMHQSSSSEADIDDEVEEDKPPAGVPERPDEWGKYFPGDMVRHPALGECHVVRSQRRGNDWLIDLVVDETDEQAEGILAERSRVRIIMKAPLYGKTRTFLTQDQREQRDAKAKKHMLDLQRQRRIASGMRDMAAMIIPEMRAHLRDKAAKMKHALASQADVVRTMWAEYETALDRGVEAKTLREQRQELEAHMEVMEQCRIRFNDVVHAHNDSNTLARLAVEHVLGEMKAAGVLPTRWQREVRDLLEFEADIKAEVAEEKEKDSRPPVAITDVLPLQSPMSQDVILRYIQSGMLLDRDPPRYDVPTWPIGTFLTHEHYGTGKLVTVRLWGDKVRWRLEVKDENKQSVYVWIMEQDKELLSEAAIQDFSTTTAAVGDMLRSHAYPAMPPELDPGWGENDGSEEIASGRLPVQEWETFQKMRDIMWPPNIEPGRLGMP